MSAGAVSAVIGPSGCGKSTLLRVIAGLQPPESGTVRWRGEDVTQVPPHRRRFGLMFQDYALFPHRSVAGNVAFGLRMAGMAERETEARVGEVLELVGLGGQGRRPIEGLSGGEQQRVALARTLAPRPELVMLDEPIGSLDRTLREHLLGEMRRIFSELDITVVYVTHDQEEAFTLADDIAVMRRGRIVAHDTVAGLWRRPGSEWTARFLGHDNILETGSPTVDLVAGGTAAASGAPMVALPAAALQVTADPHGGGVVVASVFRRGRHHASVEVGGVALTAELREPIEVGTRVAVRIAPADVIPLME